MKNAVASPQSTSSTHDNFVLWLLHSSKETKTMHASYFLRTLSFMVVMPLVVVAQAARMDDIPLNNWSAPAYWQPTQAYSRDVSIMRDGALNPQVSLPTQPLVFIAMTPCRVIDTRGAAGFPSPFGPGSLQALTPRSFPLQSSTLCSIPSAALAYSLNVTAVPVVTPGVNPPGYLGFLTLYPTGAPLPNASTLNNYVGSPNVVANAAIIPAGDNNGSITAYAHDATDMIVDCNGYYIQGSVGSSQWTTSGSNIYSSNTGNVGLGSSNPSQKLDVAGIGRFTGGIMFGDGTTQTTAEPIGSPGGSQWSTSGSNLYFNGGNVGIGTSSPGATLEVNGSLMVDNGINLVGSIYSGNSGVSVFQATNDSHNVGIGYATLQSVTTGQGNTAMGGYALHANTRGNGNSAFGADALWANTSGYQNTAIGQYALNYNTTGFLNIAIGASAMPYNKSGDSNTAVGNSALFLNTTGRFNTAMGSEAMVNNSTGNSNTALGFSAGTNLVANNNIMIANQGQADDDHVTRIGDVQAKTYIAGIFGVNISGVPVLVSSSGQLGVASSSRRFKQNIEDMADSTNNLMRLRPVTYRYKQPFEDGSQPRQFGLVAEEVAEVYPELVARSADGKIETVRYQLLDSMLLNEVQKQHEKINEQNATIATQRDKIQSLEERLARLETLIGTGTATTSK